MLRTISECDRALQLLEIERDHILKVREFLEKNGPILIPKIRPKLKADSVLQIIIDNPGLNGRVIADAMKEAGVYFEKRQVQSALNRLSKAGEIENRGKHGIGARWYIKE